MILKLQKLREGTKYESYRIAIPKAIIEAKGWKDSEFKLELDNNKIILVPMNKK